VELGAKMKKIKKTKEILKEWRKFEFKEKLNESQGSPAPITRVRHTPTKEAKDLLKELEDVYGKDIFYCYDRFDQHGDEEMIHPEYGYQIEIESLTDHVKGMSGFPNNIDVSDIVMSEDDLIYGAGLNNGIGVSNNGSFDVPWPVGPFQGDPQRYYWGEIDINGRKQKVVYKSDHGYTIYYLWPTKKSEGADQKIFKSSLGGAWG
jgi:hypothetical protein